MPDNRISEGSPFPRGATLTGEGVNFALFSANATKVELCLFDAKGKKETERIELPEYTDEVWHVHVKGLRPGTVYGYRVHGPYEPENGHRFNHHKLLLDPYAKAHVGELQWDHALFGYTIGAEGEDLTFDERDSAPFVPKCQVVDQSFKWEHPLGVRVPWERTIFYETHVRGYTKLHPAVPEPLRGTFEGLGHPAVIEHIKSLGVTSVELLPIHAFANDSHLLEQGLTNYWGYNTLGFFSADPRFFARGPGAPDELKQMIDRFHEAGLEVILDVVYNHTAEGNERGPTLSFRGIDNASYYRLLPEQKRYYINDTGTGNTLNISHPRTLQMVTDSLRYWVTELQVDGFRFDLATILGREPHGFDYDNGFLSACRQDPILSSVKMIAEPWDCGPGGYQVGGFPAGWAEWNDRFRDTAREFWKGGEHMAPELAARLTGSGDKFNHSGRRPWASVNFITAHDGFTLHDLVSYNDKHNEANGEDNRDGHSDNLSWNCGAEGPTDDPDIRALRERQKRNLLATLLFSQGTPMLVAGDEFGRSQQGNNNAYCQDNEISWVDWSLLEGGGEHVTGDAGGRPAGGIAGGTVRGVIKRVIKGATDRMTGGQANDVASSAADGAPGGAAGGEANSPADATTNGAANATTSGTTDGANLRDFVRKLTTLRHTLPVLRRGRFLTGAYDEQLQLHEVRWLSPAGADLTEEQWADSAMRCFGMVIDGRARASGIARPASDATLLLVLNAHHDVVRFTLPTIPGSELWSCLIDTNVPVREELPAFEAGEVYEVTGRSLLLFALYARGRTARVFKDLSKSLTG